MNSTVIQPIKWKPYLLLLSIVIGSNALLYKAPIFHPVPSPVLIGSMFDFLIVVPILTYYYIIRKRYSWKLTVLAALVSYGLAAFIIPDSLLKKVSFLSQVLLLLEAGFFVVELYLLITVLRRISRVKATFRELPAELPFLIKIKQAFNRHFSRTRMMDSAVSEITMIYYALFSWKKPPMLSGDIFTYHKKTSFIALNLMLIHALLIESIGLHFFFIQIDHILSLILLFLNAYSVLFLLGHMQAVRKVPLIAGKQSLIINVGFYKGIIVPYCNIKELRRYEGPETIPHSEKKNTFEALVSDFTPEKPYIDLILIDELTVDLIYGFKKKVSRVVIKVDDSPALYKLIEERMYEHRNSIEKME
ncbi:hypothetical protein [Fictibacillus barbaricus]|uniref:Beta-carotene 15,15'-monooxygenase n=1 Tax=Fictibacillus barbaricus TaxID=182136 RepID=A0ABU1TVB3_9BACL|nr:hypothetical protein [Fictibacillus barbaricus]MDR7071102.1 hypothetical protein [Fictibacillus barbaricus]